MSAPEKASTEAAARKVRDWPELEVTGCQDQTISHIVKGTYRVSGMNHNKPVYKKYEKAKGLDVLVYFWDDRDGLELCGWWFGPAVGGDQVWAFHPSRTSTTPPANEWNIPNDGPIDPSFSITPRAKDSTSGSRGKEDEKEESRRGKEDDDPVRKQLESMKKEREDVMRRMEEIQKRADERKRREEELKRRSAEEKSGIKRPRDGDADDEEQRKRKEAAVANARAEEERRRLEQEARKRKEDERRREEEEVKTRREEERRLIDEQARRARDDKLREEEEVRRRRTEQRRREEEEARKRREAEVAQRKAEEDDRRRAEAERQKERQRRLNDEARKRKEHICQLGMVEALTRLANAVPEDYDAYVSMLDKALETLLPYTGKMKEALKNEADRVLKRTAAYIKLAESTCQKWERWHEIQQAVPAALR